MIHHHPPKSQHRLTHDPLLFSGWLPPSVRQGQRIPHRSRRDKRSQRHPWVCNRPVGLQVLRVPTHRSLLRWEPGSGPGPSHCHFTQHHARWHSHLYFLSGHYPSWRNRAAGSFFPALRLEHDFEIEGGFGYVQVMYIHY